MRKTRMDEKSMLKAADVEVEAVINGIEPPK